MTATVEKPKINKVRAALEQADHSLRLEGLRESDFAAPLFERLARGEITASELKARLDAQYKPR
jgi:Antitoxin VbhA